MKKIFKLLSLAFVLAVILAFSSVCAFAVDIPERPKWISVKSDFTSITLTWDGVENATGYRVYQAVNGKWKAIKTTHYRQYTVTNLDVASNYRFAVKPYTKSGGETYWAKNYTSVYADTLQEPASPAKINVYEDFTSVTLYWDAVENATGYRVYQSVNGKWKILETAAENEYAIKGISTRGKYEYAIKGLGVGAEYKFAIKSYSKRDGVTYWSKSYTPVNCKTFGEPENPSEINALADFTSVTLSWNPVMKASGYRVYQYVNGKWKAIKTTNAIEYTVTGLAENTEYKFAIKAYTKRDGVTYWASKYAKVSSKTLGIPEKPSKITVAKNSSAVILSWEECPNATGYRIYQSVDGKWKLIACEASTKYKVEGLSANTSYKFAVKPYLEAYGNTYYASSYTTVSVKTEKTDADAEWMWPLGDEYCYISNEYGYRDSGLFGESFHDGIDIADSAGKLHGKPVYATRSGKVITAITSNKGYGIYVIIDHGDGYSSFYAHMSARYVSTGDTVNKGDMIGRVGNTGNSTGAHLHFEICYCDEKIDPLRIVAKP